MSESGGFVRAARGSDAPALARIQVACWHASLRSTVPAEALAPLTSDEVRSQWTKRWEEAIASPPTSRHRVLAATWPDPAGGSAAVAGFASAGPATDDDLWPATDGQLYELAIDPMLTRRGHGGRLLHAVADTLSEDGFRTAYTWAVEADEARQRFLISAGWAPDGGRGELDVGVPVPILRLHTMINAA